MHSFPTRRSSDLGALEAEVEVALLHQLLQPLLLQQAVDEGHLSRQLRVEDHAADGRVDDLVLDLLRSEEHTSELQSLAYLVCRLLLEKKNNHESYRPGGYGEPEARRFPVLRDLFGQSRLRPGLQADPR